MGLVVRLPENLLKLPFSDQTVSFIKYTISGKILSEWRDILGGLCRKWGSTGESGGIGVGAPFGRRWLLAAGAMAVVGAGVAVWSLNRGPAPIPASDLYTVGYGTVMETVSTSSTLQPAQQVSLSFMGTGQLSAVNVTVGQHVQTGQVLATLNDSLVAPQVLQAQAGLASAEANLQKIEEGPNPQSVAVAQAAVQHAQVVLAGDQKQYQDEQAIYNDRLSAEQNIATAQNQVNQTAAALQTAQANVVAAQNKLQQVEAGINTSSLTTLPDTISADQSALSAAQSQLTMDQGALTSAQNDEATAQTIYQHTSPDNSGCRDGVPLGHGNPLG